MMATEDTEYNIREEEEEEEERLSALSEHDVTAKVRKSVRIKEIQNEDFGEEGVEEMSDMSIEQGASEWDDEDVVLEKANMVVLHTENQMLRLSSLRKIQSCLSDIPLFDQQDTDDAISWDTLDSIESLEHNPIKRDSDFFEKFDKVPNLHDISHESLETDRSRRSYFGKFVDPLTGSSHITEIMEEKLDTEDEKSTVDEGEEESSSARLSVEMSFDDFDTDYPEPKIAKVAEKDDIEDVTKFFLTVERQTVTQEFPSKKRHVSAVDIQEHAIEFLDDIIDYAVRLCDKEKSIDILRSMLNKRKIYAEIVENFQQLVVEQKVCTFLNRKAAEFYRRKGALSFLADSKYDKMSNEKQRMEEAIKKMDETLGLEVAINEKTERRIDYLSELFNENQKTVQKLITDFEALVRRKFRADSSRELSEFLDKQFQAMNALRKEISEARAIIIQRQHNLGILKIKIDKLQDIGNGFTLSEYELLQNQTSTMNKKIEDREKELDKYHKRFHVAAHILSHTTLKTDILSKNTRRQVTVYTELANQKKKCRQNLLELKLKRNSLRNKIQDLTIQCGLLAKPALMHDFDETVERLNEKRQKVFQLKELQQKLTMKLKRLQEI